MSQKSMTIATCPVCACSLGNENIKICPGCETPHHADCWEYNSGCAIYGCPGVVVQDRRPIRAEISLSVPTSSFVFRGSMVNEGLSRLKARVALWLVVLLLSAFAVSILKLNIFIALGFLLVVYTVSQFLRDRLQIDVSRRELIRQMTLGPWILFSQATPITSLKRLSLDPCFEESGTTHKKVVRALFSFDDGSAEKGLLDMESSALTDNDLTQWAELLRRRADLQVTKAPPPRLEVLLKRIKAFQSHLGEEQKALGHAQWYWQNRWVFFAVGMMVSFTFQLPLGATLFSTLFFLLLIFGLTTFFTFFRPFELLRSILSSDNKVNPYPEPLMFYNEEENLAKLAGFLTTVEEKEFLTTLPEETKSLIRDAIIALIVITPLVYASGGLLYLFRRDINWQTFQHLKHQWMNICTVVTLLVSGLCAVINRAIWEQEWANGWLTASRVALEQLDEYKRKEDDEEEEEKTHLIEEH